MKRFVPVAGNVDIFYVYCKVAVFVPVEGYINSLNLYRKTCCRNCVSKKCIINTLRDFIVVSMEEGRVRFGKCNYIKDKEGLERGRIVGRLV